MVVFGPLDRCGQQHQTHGQQGHQTEGTHVLSCIGGRKPSGCILSGASPRNVRRGAPGKMGITPRYGKSEKGGKTFSRKSLLPPSVRHSPSALRQAAGKSVMMPVAPSATRRLASLMSLTVHTLTANPASRNAARSPGREDTLIRVVGVDLEPAAQGCRISGAYVLDQRAGGHFGAQDAAFFQITVLERGNDDLFHHIEAADEV